MIFNILGFIFIFLIAILFIGLSIIGTVIRRILGFGRKNPGYNRTPGQDDHSSQDTVRRKEPQQSSRRKVFDDDEGEYVEFEEVREE
ncbi:MAG: DUF4834 family protein [Bacteroides sp.]|nr:DUF4834 family protein [Bacteroides sp.]